jgi:glutamine amidotransferase
MTPAVTIVDYGMGNIGSICQALDLLGGTYLVSNERAEISRARALVLPGVGAFGAAMANIRAFDLVGPLTEQVCERKTPFLGICLGLQLIATDSEENGSHTGLGWIDGHVAAMAVSPDCRVPHVGWNGVTYRPGDPMFDRIDAGGSFYFDHSFHLQCDDQFVAASCEYGERYVAAVKKDNIYAVQFHPEKSQRNGLKLLRNFLNAVENREDVAC